MSGLRERKRLATFRAIRAAAIELVEQRGFDAVTVEQIAAAAGVSKRTLFNYFESKEAVIFAADPGAPEQWQELADARPPSESLWESLRQFFVGYIDITAHKLAVQKRLTSGSPELASARSTSDRLEGFLQDWVASRLGQEPDPYAVSLVVSLALAAVHAAYVSWDPDAGQQEFADLVSTGFAATRVELPEPRRKTKRTA